jgi:hypothetical protein
MHGVGTPEDMELFKQTAFFQQRMAGQAISH